MMRIFLLALVLCCVLISQADAQLVSIEIEDAQIKELYAVEYGLYTEEPIGTVAIFNPTSKELRANPLSCRDRAAASMLRLPPSGNTRRRFFPQIPADNPARKSSDIILVLIKIAYRS